MREQPAYRRRHGEPVAHHLGDLAAGGEVGPGGAHCTRQLSRHRKIRVAGAPVSPASARTTPAIVRLGEANITGLKEATSELRSPHPRYNRHGTAGIRSTSALRSPRRRRAVPPAAPRRAWRVGHARTGVRWQDPWPGTVPPHTRPRVPRRETRPSVDVLVVTTRPPERIRAGSTDERAAELIAAIGRVG